MSEALRCVATCVASGGNEHPWSFNFNPFKIVQLFALHFVLYYVVTYTYMYMYCMYMYYFYFHNYLFHYTFYSCV